MSPEVSVIELPEAASGGVELSRDELIVRVYDELRRLAASYLRRERADHTLQPTALVHEAYMRLAAQENVCWRNRDQFIGVAAEMMRRVLIDHARGHKRGKRWGGHRIPLTEANNFAVGDPYELLVLDDALRKLARRHPQKGRVVELRFFGGLSIEDTARLLGVSDSTVERDWKFAQAWLARELGWGLPRE